jgi:outer membrane lipoprotein-sorting protein
MVENPHQSDIVDEAFDALRGSQPPEGPSTQALEQTLQAVHQARRKPDRFSLFERINNMNKIIKYPVAAAIVLGVLAGAAYLLVSHSAGVAFADVKQQIEQAQTMTVTAHVKMTSLPKPMVMKMYLKSPGLMRQEITVEASPATALSTGPAATGPTTAMWGQKVITIYDMPNKRAISLVPAQKTAIVIEFKNVPPGDQGGQKNILDELKKAVVGEHKDLGAKTIAGRKVQGYRCGKPLVTTMDIWMDASTGGPVQVDQTLPNDMGTVTMTDFVINPKLDDSLFDTRPPEGYKVEKQTLDLRATEEDLIKGVALFAKYSGGVFPKALMPTPGLIEELKKVKMSEAQTKEFTMLMGKVMAFQITTMNAGGEFVYAGDGVKLGEKTTPILWYKAKDAKMYRVIYGDLHAEDAETAPKPPASPPAPSAGSGQATNGASTQPR